MGRRNVSRAELLGVFARSLERLGVQPGQHVARAAFDDALMVGCEVGPDSIGNYLAQGKAYGFWVVHEKHGKGGRGSVEFLGTRHDGAVVDADVEALATV